MDSITDKCLEEEVDAVELCTILQCLGFHIRSLESGETSTCLDGVGKTVVINCQVSGLHVVLERPSISCSCPINNREGGSGFWQITAVSGGRHHDKEFGSALLGTLPKTFRDQTTQTLQDIVKNIKLQKDKNDSYLPDGEHFNKSTSMVELNATPDRQISPTKADISPSRYRSLDALMNSKAECDFPMPAMPLSKNTTVASSGETTSTGESKKKCVRQGTYSTMTLQRQLSLKSELSTPVNKLKTNKTSSPIHSKESIMEKLVSSHQLATKLCENLNSLIDVVCEDFKDDSSMSSLTLDVSKISLHKGAEPIKNQYASSPNLHGQPASLVDAVTKTNLSRVDSASTSNLTMTKVTPISGVKTRLRKLSPSFFRSKKELSTPTSEAKNDSRTKLNNFIKPRIVTPVRIPKVTPESSPSLSARKKFSHVKSTIPKLNTKK